MMMMMKVIMMMIIIKVIMMTLSLYLLVHSPSKTHLKENTSSALERISNIK